VVQGVGPEFKSRHRTHTQWMQWPPVTNARSATAAAPGLGPAPLREDLPSGVPSGSGPNTPAGPSFSLNGAVAPTPTSGHFSGGYSARVATKAGCPHLRRLTVCCSTPRCWFESYSCCPQSCVTLSESGLTLLCLLSIRGFLLMGRVKDKCLK
jgi:hypothetical protein